MFGGFVGGPPVGDVGIDSHEVRVFRVGAEVAGWKEQRYAEPEVVSFDDVIRRVAVEDASCIRRAFGSFDMHFEGGGSRVGSTRVSSRGTAAAIGADLIEVVRRRGVSLDTRQPAYNRGLHTDHDQQES